jgi:hypothetical protein
VSAGLGAHGGGSETWSLKRIVVSHFGPKTISFPLLNRSVLPTYSGRISRPEEEKRMQTAYAPQKSKERSRLKIPVAVWRNAVEGADYAFPLKDPWGGVTYPLIRQHEWKFEGVLPAGTPVSNVRVDHADRVRCVLGGIEALTASWALE